MNGRDVSSTQSAQEKLRHHIEVEIRLQRRHMLLGPGLADGETDRRQTREPVLSLRSSVSPDPRTAQDCTCGPATESGGDTWTM
ncbi:uncharacterized protein LY89DRAFT_690729 [Mollisia scopiformis]|uniref:Uncharacterized protein n=1 Tax=Mollisia scopiformis TaxID=149040 RepID=A0A132B8F4_MOLSC|nr:uncharacterized protein LY89DRAFT_690729 [Mollisia scopiformis]KUJ08690.1 hypothetical protein LY89DRAFT_690729 [Mollisia scopiformis]